MVDREQKRLQHILPIDTTNLQMPLLKFGGSITEITLTTLLTFAIWLYTPTVRQEKVVNLQTICLFVQLESVNKLWNNEMWTYVNKWNQNKNKTKSCQIQIDHAFYYSIYSTSDAIVSLTDGFTIWRKNQKKDFLSIIYYCLAQYDVWS